MPWLTRQGEAIDQRLVRYAGTGACGAARRCLTACHIDARAAEFQRTALGELTIHPRKGNKISTIGYIDRPRRGRCKSAVRRGIARNRIIHRSIGGQEALPPVTRKLPTALDVGIEGLRQYLSVLKMNFRNDPRIGHSSTWTLFDAHLSRARIDDERTRTVDPRLRAERQSDDGIGRAGI